MLLLRVVSRRRRVTSPPAPRRGSVTVTRRVTAARRPRRRPANCGRNSSRRAAASSSYGVRRPTRRGERANSRTPRCDSSPTDCATRGSASSSRCDSAVRRSRRARRLEMSARSTVHEKSSTDVWRNCATRRRDVAGHWTPPSGPGSYRKWPTSERPSAGRS